VTPADLVEECIRTARDVDPAVQSIVDALTEERAALEAIRDRLHTFEELVPIQVRMVVQITTSASRLRLAAHKHVNTELTLWAVDEDLALSTLLLRFASVSR